MLEGRRSASPHSNHFQVQTCSVFRTLTNETVAMLLQAERFSRYRI
jgi:hypothetical protein